MAVKYKINKKRNGLGINSDKYYAAPVYKGTLNTRQLARELSQQSSLTEADVVGTLIGLGNLMRKYLQEGYTIKLDDIGSFYISASSEGFDIPEQCNASKVKFKKLCFRSDKDLRSHLQNMEFKKG